MSAGVDSAVREHAAAAENARASAHKASSPLAPHWAVVAVAHELAAIRILLAAYMEDR